MATLIPPGGLPSPTAGKKTFGVEAIDMTKRFGEFDALDQVSLKVRPGTFHALLGENGAGKSTLVKCIMGYYQADGGELIVDERQEVIGNPRAAHALGLGMVYQHFTLVPAMTVAENFVLARDDVPAVVDWTRERKALEEFLSRMPFRVPLNAKVSAISAGERQKCEILKQLYLQRRFLILDEPTSVLTPGEADEVLGMLRGMVARGRADHPDDHPQIPRGDGVRRRSDHPAARQVGRAAGMVKDLSPDAMARTMIGAEELTVQPPRTGEFGAPRLDIEKLERARRRRPAGGARRLAVDPRRRDRRRRRRVRQRPAPAHRSAGRPARGRERPNLSAGRALSCDPRGNAPQPSVGASRGAAEERLRRAHERRRQSRLSRIRPRAVRLPAAGGSIARNSTKTRCARSRATRSRPAPTIPPIGELSGGNVQRTVLARELGGEVDILVAANPCFGLDFAAVAQIHAEIMAARNRGAAVLLVSEDLDELLELADRLVVMFHGEIVYETRASEADLTEIGRHMAGH